MNYSDYRVRKYWGEKQNLFNIFTIYPRLQGAYALDIASSQSKPPPEHQHGGEASILISGC